MRILQAVTLFSPDGAYGGPVRVALNQAAALQELGHTVTITAGSRGYRPIPTSQEQVPLALSPTRMMLPPLGFAGLISPGTLTWFRRHRHEFDVVHLHLTRDLIMLPLALAVRASGLPYVVQSHGMLAPRSNALAPALDALMVRRLLRRAHTVFCLTPQEREDIAEVSGADNRITMLHNGVPLYPPALKSGGPPEVLYLARLQARKRPLDFVDVAKQILDADIEATFALVGPDEGEGDNVRAAIEGYPAISWEGPLPGGAGPARMRRASVYVLPSVNEPYPMSVLEAMSVGIPVVLTRDCGLAELVSSTGSGMVTDPGPQALGRAVKTLLKDPASAAAMGERGRETARTRAGMTSVANSLIDAYTGARAETAVRSG